MQSGTCRSTLYSPVDRGDERSRSCSHREDKEDAGDNSLRRTHEDACGQATLSRLEQLRACFAWPIKCCDNKQTYAHTSLERILSQGSKQHAVPHVEGIHRMRDLVHNHSPCARRVSARRFSLENQRSVDRSFLHCAVWCALAVGRRQCTGVVRHRVSVARRCVGYIVKQGKGSARSNA